MEYLLGALKQTYSFRVLSEIRFAGVLFGWE